MTEFREQPLKHHQTQMLTKVEMLHRCTLLYQPRWFPEHKACGRYICCSMRSQDPTMSKSHRTQRAHHPPLSNPLSQHPSHVPSQTGLRRHPRRSRHSLLPNGPKTRSTLSRIPPRDQRLVKTTLQNPPARAHPPNNLTAPPATPSKKDSTATTAQTTRTTKTFANTSSKAWPKAGSRTENSTARSIGVAR
jgi:hypothetical protein